MKKVIYWIGIYAICAFSSDYLEEIANGVGRRLHKWSTAESDPKKKGERRAKNITTDTVGEPMNRIGF